MRVVTLADVTTASYLDEPSALPSFAVDDGERLRIRVFELGATRAALNLSRESPGEAPTGPARGLDPHPHPRHPHRRGRHASETELVQFADRCVREGDQWVHVGDLAILAIGGPTDVVGSPITVRVEATDTFGRTAADERHVTVVDNQ